MNEPTIKLICAELSDHLIGQKFGKIFALSRKKLAIDFRTSDGKYLFLSVEPNSPRIYLIQRKLKELEKNSRRQPPFVSFLRKKLSNSTLHAIEKIEDERIIKFLLTSVSEFGKAEQFTLVAQLTGRSSNLFLLDDNNIVLVSLSKTSDVGQQIGIGYSVPETRNAEKTKNQESFSSNGFDTLSEALDSFFLEQEEKERFKSQANSAKTNLSKQLKKQRKLKKKLSQDLSNHGEADRWKKLGDLLLANVSTAKRDGDLITLIDYFDESAPEIQIETDENLSITEAAENFFKRYTKARNAKAAISNRLLDLDKAIEKLETKLASLLTAIEENNEEFVKQYSTKQTQKPQRKNKKKPEDSFKGAKHFVSTQGDDILVGKRSKDNDFLTFRIAKSLDYWLHAADYPGSHVIVRNPNRKEISQQTLLEAAQLAAFYSKAKKELKVAVNYTQKKYVNKPKGAQAGLVSLSNFRTILVQPKFLKAENGE